MHTFDGWNKLSSSPFVLLLICRCTYIYAGDRNANDICFSNDSAWSENFCCSNGGRADCFNVDKGTSFSKCCRPNGWIGTDPTECFQGDNGFHELICCASKGHLPCWSGLFNRSSCCRSAWAEHADPLLSPLRAWQAGECSTSLRTKGTRCKSWSRATFFAELLASQAFDGSPCVELGVQEGVFTREFLHRLAVLSVQLSRPMPQYFMVDVWRLASAEEHYTDGANVANKIQARSLNSVISNIQRFWNHTNILQMRTRDAVVFFPNSSLALVYVDARHDYCAVMEDLHMYWPKVKPGGIIGGDDYLTANGNSVGARCEDGSWNLGGVYQAVRDFAQSKGVILRTIEAHWLFQDKHPRPQWWILKPKGWES